MERLKIAGIAKAETERSHYLACSVILYVSQPGGRHRTRGTGLEELKKFVTHFCQTTKKWCKNMPKLFRHSSLVKEPKSGYLVATNIADQLCQTPSIQENFLAIPADKVKELSCGCKDGFLCSGLWIGGFVVETGRREKLTPREQCHFQIW